MTDANPGLAALIVTSEQAGTPLTISFTVDTTSGGFTGFDGHAAFCGKGSLTAGGDGKVGNAVTRFRPRRRRQEGPQERRQPQDVAAVHAVGTINSGTGAISITTDVRITVAAAGVTIAPGPRPSRRTGRPAAARSRFRAPARDTPRS